MSLTEEQIKGIAAQLSKPEGDFGIEVARNMHESNIGMTLNTAQQLKIASGDAILELGHGNGQHIGQILNQAENSSYYGLEISELMMQEAKNQHFPNASFYLYDGKNIPFDNLTFNKVFTVNTIYFWKEPVQLINEVYRVLKDNGTFCIGFAQEEFMKSLPFAAYGFNLYNDGKLEELTHQTPFKLINLRHYTEQVRSKADEMVERVYTVATLVK